VNDTISSHNFYLCRRFNAWLFVRIYILRSGDENDTRDGRNPLGSEALDLVGKVVCLDVSTKNVGPGVAWFCKPFRSLSGRRLWRLGNATVYKTVPRFPFK
jgi:hypothetical protein